MKQCPNCSAKNDDNAAFCESCGADLRNVAIMPDERSATIGDFLSKAKEAAAAGAKKAKEAAEAGSQKVRQAMADAEENAQARRQQNVSAGEWDSAVETQGYTPNRGAAPQGGNSILVDQSETVVASIGSNYLQNYLSGSNVSKGVGILTQKRFYYKGRNFSGAGKAMKSTTQEGVVSIDDIAFTQFTFTRHIGFLIFATLLTLTAVGCFIYYMDHTRGRGEFAAIAWAAVLVALPFYILYFVKRQTIFLISFPGGGFAFDIRWYPISDIRDFQRQLHLLKDYIMSTE